MLNRITSAILLVLFVGVAGAAPPDRIAFYGTLSGGLAEAKRSGRPILLLSAAPHCHGVSGLW